MTTAIEHDPKIDPQPGDTLTAFNGRSRKVIRRDKNYIWYLLDTGKKEHKCWLGQWLEWTQQHVP
jgi:hypothetical protein